eukprot:2660111-Alexandrium_andersonii.AAC.1
MPPPAAFHDMGLGVNSSWHIAVDTGDARVSSKASPGHALLGVGGPGDCLPKKSTTKGLTTHPGLRHTLAAQPTRGSKHINARQLVQAHRVVPGLGSFLPASTPEGITNPVLDPLYRRPKQIDDIALVSSDGPNRFPLPLQLLHNHAEESNRAVGEGATSAALLPAPPDLGEEPANFVRAPELMDGDPEGAQLEARPGQQGVAADHQGVEELLA